MAEDENPWKPYDVNDDDIAEEAKKHRIFIVDCWAEWCAPCKTLSRYLEKLSFEYKDEVTFVKLDTEANKASSKKYGITTVPTLLLFYEGKFTDIILGAMDMDYIRGVIEEMKARMEKGDE